MYMYTSCIARPAARRTPLILYNFRYPLEVLPQVSLLLLLLLLPPPFHDMFVQDSGWSSLRGLQQRGLA